MSLPSTGAEARHAFAVKPTTDAHMFLPLTVARAAAVAVAVLTPGDGVSLPSTGAVVRDAFAVKQTTDDRTSHPLTAV